MFGRTRSGSTRVGRLVAGPVVGFVVAGLLVTGCGRDCIMGESGVLLEVTRASWPVTAFCVDDECIPAGEIRSELPDGARSDGYVIRVSDREPSLHRYRVELTAPDGTQVVREGDVETTGNRMGGETCRPTTFNASLVVAADGLVTIPGSPEPDP